MAIKDFPTDMSSATIDADNDFLLFSDTSDSNNAKKTTLTNAINTKINDGTTSTTKLWSSDKINTELDAKQDVLTGLTASVAELNILDGATLTTTELNYVDGVTSAIQTQLDNKQPLDADLTTIAGLTATTDNFMQAKAGAWASRTIAQVKTDLGLSGTNSGDQTSIVGITGTKAEFNNAVTDGNFLYDGDVTSNATHTGDVTGSTALTIDKTAITGKTAVTAVGADYVLISDTSDSGNLKKALVSDLIGAGGTIDGSGTTNEIPYWVDSDTLGSLTTATYPSLTELSYVKGVTSAIQTQLNAKGTGTVTSVAMTVPTGLTVSGTPITTTGTLALSLDTGYEIPLSATISNKADKSGALTQFLGNGNWKVWYSDGSGDVQELALGASGTYLKSNGASSAPSFATPAGGGTPGGSNTQFQYNNAGSFGGIAELTWNNTNKQIAFEAIDDTGGVAEWASYIHDTGESIYSYISHTRDVIEFLVNDGTDESSFQGIGAGLSFSTTGYTRFNGNGVYDFKGTESQAAEARLYEDTDNGSNYVSLKAPTSIASSKTITLPDTTGTLALVTGTGDAITVGTIELGHASDTTIARASAGVASIEGNNIVVNTSSPTLATITTTGNIELGHASDTTLSRSSAGVLAVEGVVVPTISSTNTFTNKRWTDRVGTTTSSGTPTINTDNYDMYTITALAENITSFTTNLSGTPTTGQILKIRIKDNGTARTITWGSSFAAAGEALPTTTVISKTLRVGFEWNEVSSKWECIASAQEA